MLVMLKYMIRQVILAGKVAINSATKLYTWNRYTYIYTKIVKEVKDEPSTLIVEVFETYDGNGRARSCKFAYVGSSYTSGTDANGCTRYTLANTRELKWPGGTSLLVGCYSICEYALGNNSNRWWYRNSEAIHYITGKIHSESGRRNENDWHGIIINYENYQMTCYTTRLTRDYQLLRK